MIKERMDRDSVGKRIYDLWDARAKKLREKGSHFHPDEKAVFWYVTLFSRTAKLRAL